MTYQASASRLSFPQGSPPRWHQASAYWSTELVCVASQMCAATSLPQALTSALAAASHLFHGTNLWVTGSIHVHQRGLGSGVASLILTLGVAAEWTEIAKIRAQMAEVNFMMNGCSIKRGRFSDCSRSKRSSLCCAKGCLKFLLSRSRSWVAMETEKEEGKRVYVDQEAA